MTGPETIIGLASVLFLARILGYAALAGATTTFAAFMYRIRIRQELPESAALIVGVGVVAIYLNTRLVLVQFIGDGGDVLTVEAAVTNIILFVGAAAASFGGRSLGHRAAASERLSWAGMQPSLSPIVRATGRFITVTLPDSIDDIEGYDPVSETAKTALAERTFEFPRGLTVGELERQLTTRLTEKHDIGYVDVELAEDGTVEYLAVGQRPAGLGKTLPPGMAAVALRADPPFSGSPGDTVEIWGGEEPQAIGVAELRAGLEESATVAADEALCEQIDPNTQYRLMTLAGDAQPDREFAAQLRRSEETMAQVRVLEGSDLVGVAVGAIDLTVIALQRGDDVITIPERAYELAAGDRLYLVGRPDRLRKIEASAGVEVVTGEGPDIAALGWRPGSRNS